MTGAKPWHRLRRPTRSGPGGGGAGNGFVSTFRISDAAAEGSRREPSALVIAACYLSGRTSRSKNPGRCDGPAPRSEQELGAADSLSVEQRLLPVSRRAPARTPAGTKFSSQRSSMSCRHFGACKLVRPRMTERKRAARVESMIVVSTGLARDHSPCPVGGRLLPRHEVGAPSRWRAPWPSSWDQMGIAVSVVTPAFTLTERLADCAGGVFRERGQRNAAAVEAASLSRGMCAGAIAS